MGFEIFTPFRVQGIGPGTASIDCNGKLRFHGSDLRRLGIDKEATLLTDPAAKRIALRKPRAGEPTVAVRWAKTGTGGGVGLTGVLKVLKIDPKKAKGRYDVASKDDLLIVQLPSR